MSKCKRRSDTETFKFSNLNPKGQKTGDCVIRAALTIPDSRRRNFANKLRNPEPFILSGWRTIFRSSVRIAGYGTHGIVAENVLVIIGRVPYKKNN